MTISRSLFSALRPGDYAILGDPVAHSLSPVMQNAALADLWAREKWPGPPPFYHKFPVSPGDLPDALNIAIKAALGGVNITVPHKEAALTLVADLDPAVKRLGAINTIFFDGGRPRGYNTDLFGFLSSLDRQAGWKPSGQKVVVLGAGGTGRVIIKGLIDEGALVSFWNRNPEKSAALAADLGASAMDLAGKSEADIARAVAAADVVVNATAVGLSEGDGLPIPTLVFRPGQIAFDVVYHRETEFLRRARESGARALGGLGMLLHQGARAFEIWHGVPAPLDIMKGALIQQLQNKGQTSSWLFDI